LHTKLLTQLSQSKLSATKITWGGKSVSRPVHF
jgi:hypothetical protein